MNDSLVTISDLSKTFGGGETRVDAVRDVDLELGRGEIVLVMGPSGSGKTTLLSMLGGLLRPTEGEIHIDGVDIAALSERELPPFRATRFGFIFQDFNLLAALTARENVEVALNLGGVRGQKAHQRAEELLVALGLVERLDFGVDQLSGGEKQRVAIARAIANSPQVIFADEPTANLDSARGAETMRLLRQLAKDEGTTVVIVSHDQRLREIADRVLWLEDGQLKHLEALVRDPCAACCSIRPRRRPAWRVTARPSTSAPTAVSWSTASTEQSRPPVRVCKPRLPEPFARSGRRDRMHYCALFLLAIFVVLVVILVVLA